MGKHPHKSPHYGELQLLVDELFAKAKHVRKLDLVINAEIRDLHPDLLEICSLVPNGSYDRQTLCDQMNSSITAHGWGGVYGTVD